MKKTLIAITALGLLIGYLFQEPIREAADNWKTRDMFVSADSVNFYPGISTGASIPPVQASHQGRPVESFNEFVRGNGAIIIALRSVDWCAYCKHQIIQLQEYAARFHASGIGLVAITYDTPETQRLFIEKFGITIPVLSDENSVSFRALGILNEDIQPGESEYGIPHPGMIVIDREGVVAGKLFVQTPTLRVDSAQALLYAKRVLGVRGLFGGS